MTWLDLLVVGLALATAVYNFRAIKKGVGPLDQFVAAGSQYKQSVDLLAEKFDRGLERQSQTLDTTLKAMTDANDVHSQTVREAVEALNQSMGRISKIVDNLIDKLP